MRPAGRIIPTASRAEHAFSMMRLRFISAALLALLARATAVAAQSPPADTLAIEHVTVLPMDRDTALTDHKSEERRVYTLSL